jgi:hypothetical protein
VGEYCSCGAKLPDDARFCHKCGKPQYDEPLFQTVPEPQAVSPATVPPPLPQHAGINFRNSVAVRVGFLAAGLVTTLLFSMPMPPAMMFAWFLLILTAGGFFSVYLYRRRTGESLSVLSGARMGWITGVFCFAIMTIVFTFGIFTIANSEGLNHFFANMAKTAGRPEMVQQFNLMLQDKSGIAVFLFLLLATFFVMLTLFPVVGGALGAKVLAKD